MFITAYSIYCKFLTQYQTKKSKMVPLLMKKCKKANALFSGVDTVDQVTARISLFF